MSYSGLTSPVPITVVKDEKFFEKSDTIKILPYYGSTAEESHESLRLRDCIASLSPSIGAIKRSFMRFVFGGGFEFTTPEMEDRLKEWSLSKAKIIRAAKCIESYSMVNLNRWLRVQIITTSGVTKVNLTPINPRHVAYLQKKRKKGDLAYPVIVTENWVHSEWGVSCPKPDILPATRYEIDDTIYWEEKKVGESIIYEAVIHATDINCRGRYDESLIDGLLDSLVAEIKYLILTGKIANSEVLSKNIFAFQELAPEQGSGTKKKRNKGIQLVTKMLNKFMTNSGDRDEEVEGVMSMTYPMNGEAPQHYKLDINRNAEYQKFGCDKIESQIYAVYEWSRILTGMDKTAGGIGADHKVNELICASPTIDGKRNWYDAFMTYVLSEVAKKITGLDTEVKIEFNDTIEPLVEKLSRIKGNRNVNNNG